MKKPELPPDECQRLKDLREYNILDTDSENTFDQITSLAAQIFGCKYSFVSFVDKGRQWFKSRHGLDLSETPRDISFCGHAILGDDIFIIEDTSKDERFHDNPVVTGEPFIKFYAGAPLITPSGTKLGTLCVFDSEAKVLTDSQKNILRSLANHVVDLLELRKKTAQVGSYARIFHQSVDPVMTLSPPEWKFTSANPATLKLFDVESEEKFLSMGPWDISPVTQPDGEASSAKAQRMIDQAMEKGSAFFDWQHSTFSGKNISCTVLLSRIEQGESSYLQATVRNTAGDSEIEQKHRMLLETMSEGLVILTKNGVDGYNSAALRILQLTHDEITARVKLPEGWKAIREDGSLYPFRDHPAIIALKTGAIIPAIRMGVRLPDNEVRWITINSVPVDGPNGRMVISTFSDITPLIRAAEEHRFVLDAIGIGVWKVNLLTGTQIWDRKMYQLFGVDTRFTNDFNNWMGLLSDESKLAVDDGLAKILSGSNTFDADLEVVGSQGQKIILGSKGQVIRNKANEAIMIYGINWDRTQELELQKNLEIERARSLHNAKLASIGQLAAGVGHEINNPLAILSGLISMTEQLLLNGTSQNDLSDKFRKMESSVIRISNIVKGLRTFARSDKDEVSDFDPYHLINETVDLLKDIYGKEGVSISIMADKIPVVMRGNRGRLQQVLVNLLSNAKDASIGQGVRAIKLMVIPLASELEISIKDNGSGIPAEIREKIFEPFFTTKDVNLGTGIGLSLVNTIVKEHEGKIELKSEIGKGSEFRIRLPVKSVVRTPVPDLLSKKPILNKINCRVLVVDDESDLRAVLKEILSYNCSEVVTAESGKHALKILKEGNIDVVLSDIKMPVMDGFDFLKAMREDTANAHVKFLFITGGIEMSEAELKVVKRDSDGIFYKPVKFPELFMKLKTLFP
ncbi:MAG: ATP-binding protein [Bdellovibrionota bacterium]